MPTEADLHLGGQALMEGVMMRSERFYAAAVRRKDGSIQIIDEPIKPRWRRTKLMMIPPLRGLAVLLETMTLGIKLTRWSADAFMEDAGQQKTSNRGFAIELAISFAIVIGLFVALPHLIAGWGDTIDAFGRWIAFEFLRHFLVFDRTAIGHTNPICISRGRTQSRTYRGESPSPHGFCSKAIPTRPPTLWHRLRVPRPHDDNPRVRLSTMGSVGVVATHRKSYCAPPNYSWVLL